jgi:hypothetical protein
VESFLYGVGYQKLRSALLILSPKVKNKKKNLMSAFQHSKTGFLCVEYSECKDVAENSRLRFFRLEKGKSYMYFLSLICIFKITSNNVKEPI